MKQIIQNLKSGETLLEDIPAPAVKPGHVLIKTHRSLVSPGTEKMLVEFGKANLISKARKQPDKVKQVLDKVRSDGLMPTLESVFLRLEEPLPLGYCNAGEVVEVGEGVTGFKKGDRVVSNGPHAEYVNVPKNLVAPIPENVSYREAAFTVTGAIGLQGIRLAAPTLGESVTVMGLGLIGLLTAELLLANGCHVTGFDFDQQKVDMAREKGVHAYNLQEGMDPVATVSEETQNIGADAVIITASSQSNDLISQAARMSRKRGRIILVGVIGLELNRAEFYDKELTFQVSCSYGPGRYDEEYEQQGKDYPLPFVRWTENRNFRAILDSIAKGRLDVTPLVTEEVPLKDYKQIYGNMGGNSIASLLKYEDTPEYEPTVHVKQNSFEATQGTLAIAGAGNFTKMTVLPALKKHANNIKYIVSKSGVSGTHLAKKYGIARSSTEYEAVLKDPEVDAVLITTQHNLHKSMVIQGLEANKHVFVEKPLVLKEDELEEVSKAYEASKGSVTVGFNRRFAPFIEKARELTGREPGPVNLIINANAGYLPADHWLHNPDTGGGRIIGEACHFIDLAVYLSQSPVKAVIANALGTHPEENTDNASIILKHENGSQSVVNYFANGSKAYSKERLELYSRERTLVIDNFRTMQGYGFKGFKKSKSGQDKGHKAQFKQFMEFIKQGGEPLIPFEEIINVHRATFGAIKSLKEGKWVEVIK